MAENNLKALKLAELEGHGTVILARDADGESRLYLKEKERNLKVLVELAENIVDF